jgi:hypothetical protein
VRLRRLEDRLSRETVEGLLNYRAAREEVHVLPSQPQEFTLPHTRCDGRDVQRIVGTRALRLREKEPHLFVIENAHLRPGRPRRVHEIAGVTTEEPPPHCMAQGLVEDPVMVKNRRGR